MFRFVVGGVTMVALAALLGCGGSSSKGTVSGKVTYKGDIVPNGTVNFHGKDKEGKEKVGSGSLQANGSYTVNDAAVGPNKITVNTPQAPKGIAAPPPDPTGKSTPIVSIPEEYGDAAKSTLTLDVKAGNQNFNIDLK